MQQPYSFTTVNKIYNRCKIQQNICYKSGNRKSYLFFFPSTAYKKNSSFRSKHCSCISRDQSKGKFCVTQQRTHGFKSLHLKA
ncbi:hypothetical protein RchiOBHm_Chr0c32g0501531 [Rosa chinensis]|uniref:Uncharacterized protein n=1 Tax=Rosa chinensis TaxID=74649 RepID=A0A2P6SQA1_ROSCH|nr:hypothetical protein RchiOBHm_Chr0c32g0501531 [Rosa chinensis]